MPTNRIRKHPCYVVTAPPTVDRRRRQAKNVSRLGAQVLVDLKHSDIRTIDNAFQSSAGYVLDFSDKTLREYFGDEFGIEIDDRKYSANGSSKMNRLRTFFRLEDAAVVSRVFRSLWAHRQAVFPARPGDSAIEAKLFELLSRIEGGGSVARTDAIDRFSPDERVPSQAIPLFGTYWGDREDQFEMSVEANVKMALAHL
jgi:hypothetical protein